MKLRLRQYEFIFVTIAGLILLGSFLWHLLNLSPAQVNTNYALPFIQNKVPFNLFRNVLLPNIGAGFMVYAAYVFVNFFTIPRFLLKKENPAGTPNVSVALHKISPKGTVRGALKKSGWLFLQIALIILLLGIGLNCYAYFINECYFRYEGFTFLPGNGYHPQPLMGLSVMFRSAFAMVGFYGLYAIVREMVIYYFEQPGVRRDYRILIFNQITLFLIEYLLVPFFLISFNFIGGYVFFIAYFALVPSMLLVFMINIYVLFPWKRENNISNSVFLRRLLLSTFLCTLPFSFLLIQKSSLFVPALLLLWLVQLLFVTPLSWLDYRHRKDKIQQLKGVQNELIRSKTDLQFLKSQINPHFLFNILNTLYGTALQENAERTAGGIQKLGEMMRFMLHENTLDFIYMVKEIEYLKNYISLQKLRTGTSTGVIIDDHIEDGNCNHKIAPMLLIPFVENAFKHGISLHYPSWIKIDLTCNEKSIIFEVRNSIHSTHANNPEPGRAGIGLKNVLTRLKLIYGEKFRILMNNDGNEYFVSLVIQP